MCLVVFAWKTHPEHRLVMVANRDELHKRPAQALQWWPDRPDVLAGRDLQAGGTWLAVSRSGRFATVTNYREQRQAGAGLRSRGDLVTDFVAGRQETRRFVESIEGDRYAGFSLLAGDKEDLWYVSNRGDGPDRLPPGIYGLSNASLDTPWSKLVRSREALGGLIDTNAVNQARLMRILEDRTPAPVADIEPGELPLDLARAISAPFIVTPDYGTRCTSVLSWSNSGEIEVGERRYDASGKKTGESGFRFTPDDG